MLNDVYFSYNVSKNPFYGLNWGSTADTIIEESLDTGDLLFFKYDC